MDRFWLVQRLSLRDPPQPDRGFDGFFEFDYMGAAEYEFGVANANLKSMREGTLRINEVALTGASGVTKPVYFVADPKTMTEDLMTEFREWYTRSPEYWQGPGKPMRQSKESTYFNENFDGTASDYRKKIVAWWSYGDDVAWAIDRQMAERLLTAFLVRGKKVSNG